MKKEKEPQTQCRRERQLKVAVVAECIGVSATKKTSEKVDATVTTFLTKRSFRFSIDT